MFSFIVQHAPLCGAVDGGGVSGGSSGVHRGVAMLPCEVGPCVVLVVCVFASAVFAPLMKNFSGVTMEKTSISLKSEILD